MKRSILTVFAMILMLGVCVTPVAAANKVVNNDRTSTDPYFVTDCDKLSGWIASEGVKVSFDEDEATEGMGAVCFVTDIPAYSNANLDIRGNFDPVDISNADFVTFDMYLSHPELINSTYQITVTLGSGGYASSQTVEWKAVMFLNEYVEGWNTVTLPMGGMQTNTANLNAVDNFRIYFHTINFTEDAKGMTVRFDNMEAHTFSTKAIPLLNCDTEEHWGGGIAGIETTHHVEGEGALVFHVTPVTVEGGDHHLVKQIVFPKPVDGANADYLEFDLYVSDAAALREDNSNYGLQVELTSSGRCDAEEFEWGVEQGCGKMKDGWNHVRLAIPALTPTGPNMRAVNFFRLHLLNLKSCRDETLVIMLDNVYLSVRQDGIDDYAEPEPEPVPPDQQPEQPEQPEQPTVDQPIDPPAQGEDISLDTEAAAARRALTATRAKAIVVVFAFFVIAFDVVAVALRRRKEASLPEVPVEAPTDMLDAAAEPEQPCAPDTQEPITQQSEQTPDEQV